MPFFRLLAAAFVATPLMLAAPAAFAQPGHGAPARVMMPRGRTAPAHMVSYHRHRMVHHPVHHRVRYSHG